MINQEAEERNISNALDYDKLLNDYGPEGLYAIAQKLKDIANEDVNLALKQCEYEIIENKFWKFANYKKAGYNFDQC